jgi:hypothetical protein|eukprot:COSAG01_NODE_11146_length_1996_cov_524.305746_2_plen_50_part_00
MQRVCSCHREVLRIDAATPPRQVIKGLVPSCDNLLMKRLGLSSWEVQVI